MLWVWLDEWLSVAWGPVKGRFARAGTQSRYGRERAVVRTDVTGYVRCSTYNSKFKFFPQQKMHNISHCLNWIQEGVENLFLLAIIFCIHSLHNLNHVLLFMQITLAFLGENIYIYIYIYHHKKDVFP